MARKNYVQFPQRAFYRELTHAQYHILTALCLLDYRYARGSGHERFFFITDRELADFCSCDRHTLRRARLKLQEEGLVAFWRGPGNKTHYRVIFAEPT